MISGGSRQKADKPCDSYSGNLCSGFGGETICFKCYWNKFEHRNKELDDFFEKTQEELKTKLEEKFKNPKNLKRELSNRHEQAVADLLPNGQRTVGSGAILEKLDVQTKDDGSNLFLWLVECKATQQKSFSVTKTLWNEVESRTYERSRDRRPALAIRFYDEDKHVEKDLVVLDLNDFIELLKDVEDDE